MATKNKRKRAAYDPVGDGQWFGVPKRGEEISCCDCGLVHHVKASKRRGRIGLRFWRLSAQTGGIRKGMGVQVVKKR